MASNRRDSLLTERLYDVTCDAPEPAVLNGSFFAERLRGLIDRQDKDTVKVRTVVWLKTSNSILGLQLLIAQAREFRWGDRDTDGIVANPRAPILRDVSRDHILAVHPRCRGRFENITAAWLTRTWSMSCGTFASTISLSAAGTTSMIRYPADTTPPTVWTLS